MMKDDISSQECSKTSEKNEKHVKSNNKSK